MASSSENLLQLDHNSIFSEPILEDIIKDFLYTLRLIYLAQAIVEIDEDDKSMIENANSFDVLLIIQS